MFMIKKNISPSLMKRCLHFSCLAWIMALPLHAEFRTWANPTGAKLDAELVKAEGDNVTLRLRNGKLSTFSQSKLSDADRNFIKNHKVETPPAPTPSLNANRKAKWLTKMEKAQEEAKETGLPILVLFTGSSWCPYCVKLEHDVFSEKAFKSYADENLVLLMLDFEPGGVTKNKEHQKLQAEFGVSGFPTYFLTNASGTKLAQGGFYQGINPANFMDWVKQSAPKK